MSFLLPSHRCSVWMIRQKIAIVNTAGPPDRIALENKLDMLLMLANLLVAYCQLGEGFFICWITLHQLKILRSTIQKKKKKNRHEHFYLSFVQFTQVDQCFVIITFLVSPQNKHFPNDMRQNPFFCNPAFSDWRITYSNQSRISYNKKAEWLVAELMMLWCSFGILAK